MHEATGVEEVNAALLSLINEACVNVCCATLLSSELVGPACVQARSSNQRISRACRPSGKRSGEEGILSDVVPVYLYCMAFNVSVSLGVESRHACLQAAQPLSIPHTVGPGRTVSGACGQRGHRRTPLPGQEINLKACSPEIRTQNLPAESGN